MRSISFLSKYKRALTSIKIIIITNEFFLKFWQIVTYAQNYMYNSFKNETCRLTMAQYRTASANYFMGCPKNSPYSAPLFEAYDVL